MKRINHYTVFRIATLLLIIHCSNSFADRHPANVITSSNKSFSLRHWQISKDQEPGSTLHNPPDSLWLPLYPTVDNDRYDEGNWIIKTEVIIDDSLDKETTWGLFLAYFTTAYEVYWDGSRLAQNGVIGTDRGGEEAGTLRYHVMLPAQLLTSGNHTIVLRVSHYHDYSNWKWFYGECAIAPYDAGVRSLSQMHDKDFFIIGILCIPLLLNLFLYVARDKRADHLLFSLMCVIVILDSVTSLAPAIADVPTTYVHWEVYAYQTLTFLFVSLLPAFLIHLFSFPRKIIAGVIGVNLCVYLFFSNLLNVFGTMSLTVLVISSVMTLWALWNRREGSMIIAIGLVAGWAAYSVDIAFDGLATIMVVCTSIFMARQFVRSERAEKEAQLRSAQLENELLRKHINPHFLLNTLTSIIVWLRRDPRSAIVLVEALAEEFRMILKISGLKQIPVKQEIDLCKAHLTIMNLRKGAQYRLETLDMLEDESVPPMLFHTLVENGLTHGYESKTQGTFILQRRETPGVIQYALSNDGDYSCDESVESTGFGLRYVRSRLEESYPHRWTFTSHRQERGWESIIEIKGT